LYGTGWWLFGLMRASAVENRDDPAEYLLGVLKLSCATQRNYMRGNLGPERNIPFCMRIGRWEDHDGLPKVTVKTIAIMPSRGLLADAVAAELMNHGFTIIDAAATSNLMIHFRN
jgi:hypothetical protein